MSDYNFDDGNNEFGETIRLDGINDEVQKIENKRADLSLDNDKFQRYVREENEREMLHERVKVHSNMHSQKSNDGMHNSPKKAAVHSNNTGSNGTLQKRKKSSSNGGRPSNPKNNKQYKLFMMLAIAGGVIIFLGMFALAFNGMNSGKKPTTPEVEVPTVTDKIEKNFYALIKNINTGKEISYYDVIDGKNSFIKANDQTIITDVSGTKLTLSDVKVGDIVNIVLSETGDTAKEIKYTSETWVKNKISDFTLDKTLMTITYDNNTHIYNEETIVQYDGKPTELSKLDPMDTITIKGYESKIWSIEVNEYHGSIIVKNKDKITDGTIEIDSKKSIKLGEIDKISVTGGAHNVVIKGSNIETSTQDIYVASGDEYEIDLSNTQSKTGVIVIKTNVNDYKLFVNGNETAEAGEPLVLAMGEYALKITKEGYTPWEQKVTLSEASMEVTAELVEEILLGDVTISTEPSGSYLYIDDTYIGVSPVLVKLTYGEHRLIIKTDGYEDVNAPITVNKPSDVVNVILIETPNINAGTEIIE